MQPDAVITRKDASALLARIPVAWRGALGALLASIATLVLVTAREWGEMFHQWWNIDTYNHILLIPIIVFWLIAMKASDFAKLAPRPWLPGLGLIAAGLGLWLVGRLSDINLIAHAGAVGALQGAIVAVLGLRVALFAALPLGMIAIAVPFGDEIIAPLQWVTAEIAITLTHWSGVPAVIDGIHIDTPVGLFIVAEACSGVKFLIAMVTLAVLICFTRFDSWSRRAVFMLASIIVPIIANGVRAWGTIYIAQFQGVEFAAGFDHIFYGWIFFGIVVAVLLAAAWRYFEREPDEYGWSADTLSGWAWVARLERYSVSPALMAALIAAQAITVAVLNAIVAPAAIS
jgi:exosortase A